MIQTFETGGCFHSRTAMGMYAHVRAAVDAGEVLLEWDYKKVGVERWAVRQWNPSPFNLQ